MPELLLIILGPILCALIIYFLPVKLIRPFTLTLQIFVLIQSVRLFEQVLATDVVIYNIGNWPESAGIALVADRPAAVMIMFASVMFILLLLFDLSQAKINRSFITLFLILEGLLAGIFLSGDLFNIYILIEIATIVVTLLILFDVGKRSVYDGIFYIMINMTAMTMYLFGLGILYRQTGTLSLLALPDILSAVNDKKSLILPFALMSTAISLKAAVFPLFSWLPKAHGSPGAPSSVSALLSGLYVKTGLLLLFRLISTFSLAGTDTFFLIAGLFTAFSGIVFALIQTDIKKMLGYSTISQIGLIIVAFSYGSANSQAGAWLHIVNHGLFKSALFLSAGIVVERFGTRDMRKLNNVFRRMPWVSIAMIMAMLGVTGAPFFNGSVSKYLIKTDFTDGLLKLSLLLINLGTVLYFIRLSRIFKKDKKKDSSYDKTVQTAQNRKTVSENISIIRTEPIKIAAVMILGMLCLLTGVSGGYLSKLLFNHELILSFEIIADNAVTWILTLLSGLIIYRLAAKPLVRLQSLRLKEPGFNQVCMGIGAYLAAMIIFLSVI